MNSGKPILSLPLGLRPLVAVRPSRNDFLKAKADIVAQLEPRAHSEGDLVEELTRDWLNLKRIAVLLQKMPNRFVPNPETDERASEHSKNRALLAVIAGSWSRNKAQKCSIQRAERIAPLVVEAALTLLRNAHLTAQEFDDGQPDEPYWSHELNVTEEIEPESLGALSLEVICKVLTQTELVTSPLRERWIAMLRATLEMHQIDVNSIEVLKQCERRAQEALKKKVLKFQNPVEKGGPLAEGNVRRRRKLWTRKEFDKAWNAGPEAIALWRREVLARDRAHGRGDG